MKRATLERGPRSARLRYHQFGLLPLVYFVASSPAILLLCAVAKGLGMGPAVANGFDLVNQFVPAESLTEGG
ncbi:hypothetical protein [Amycolatopsis sp. NPDC051061]|uniref:hypothetical protein n=1 Tax=Amycolatopsis sp. NPDC051061 TaxID=3155042 RepID=UPI003444BEF2